jgi:hypothetical protein
MCKTNLLVPKKNKAQGQTIGTQNIMGAWPAHCYPYVRILSHTHASNPHKCPDATILVFFIGVQTTTGDAPA